MTAERSYQFTSTAPPAKPVAVDTPEVRTAARPRAQVYWFHPDHLGAGTLITDLEGRPHQFFLNLPYGETFIEQGGYRYDNPYKFNGKELDEETGLYYYGARYYDPKISLWLSVDPLAGEYPGMSPYVYTYANPLKFIDPTGMEGEAWDGDYYGKNGKYLGSDGKNDNKVYVADGKRDDGTFINAKELSVSHTVFKELSYVIYMEAGTSDKEENLWIAHATNNYSKKVNKSLYNLLKSGYSSVSHKAELSPSLNSAKANAARYAILDVLLGGEDPTGGATHWDGIDFIIKGFSHPKFKQYKSIYIPLDIFYHHLNQVVHSKYNRNGIVRFNKKKYLLPSSDFFKPNYLFSFGFYKENAVDYWRPTLTAVGAKGLSIFWKSE